jgi:hypothetical protein
VAISRRDVRHRNEFEWRRALTEGVVAEARDDGVRAQCDRVICTNSDIDTDAEITRHIALAVQVDAEAPERPVVEKRCIVERARFESRDARAIEIRWRHTLRFGSTKRSNHAILTHEDGVILPSGNHARRTRCLDIRKSAPTPRDDARRCRRRRYREDARRNQPGKCEARRGDALSALRSDTWSFERSRHEAIWGGFRREHAEPYSRAAVTQAKSS